MGTGADGDEWFRPARIGEQPDITATGPVVVGRPNVITFVLDSAVLGNTRFAFSPLAETTLSLRALQEPHAGHVMAPWIRWAREHLDDIDMALVAAAAPAGRWVPSCLVPPSEGPAVTIDAQLADLAAGGPSVLAADLDLAWQGQPRRQAARRLVAGDPATFTELIGQLGKYWEACIEPFWPRMCAVLEDDVSHRVQVLVRSGLYEMLNDLHPEAHIEGDRLLVHKPHHDTATFHATAMTLVPSVFAWPRLILEDGEPGCFELTYSARGVARVWDALTEMSREPDPLAALLGRTRAAILARVAVPISTTQLARELQQSPASVSQHLTVLREAGLVTSRRSGRSVLYRQTGLAQSMLQAQATAGRAPVAVPAVLPLRSSQ